MAGEDSGSVSDPIRATVQRTRARRDETGMLSAITDPDHFVTTRVSWHTLAERVLAPARAAATGRIGLRPTAGGITTGPFGADRTLSVVDTDLLVIDGTVTRRSVITTLGEAAAFAGTDPAATTGVFVATTPADPDAPLPVDPAAAAALAEWFAFGARVLGTWRAEHADETPSEIQLWPEHFDLGLDLGPEGRRANYGASPGDGASALPYLYVGPWEPSDDPFWTEGTYAALGYDALGRHVGPRGSRRRVPRPRLHPFVAKVLTV